MGSADVRRTPSMERLSKGRKTEEKWKEYFKEYNDVTGIQGLRYVTEGRSTTEQIVWIVILLASAFGFGQMTYELASKYKHTPVVVNFATENTPIIHVPFPAVTVCPPSKFSTKNFNMTETCDRLMNNKTVQEDALDRFHYVNALCGINVTGPNHLDERFFETIEKVQAPMSWFCEMNEKPQYCEKLSVPVLTDEGICYTFNTLDRSDIFRDNVFQYGNFYMVNKTSDYDLETGYSDAAGVKTHPKRAWTAGVHSALKIFLAHDDQTVDYSCTQLVQGYKLLVHHPATVPRLSLHSLTAPFERVVSVTVEPRLVTTSRAVRRFKVKRRKCYFSDERRLKYFKQYTQENCLYECLTNHTLATCGCVAFHMPREKTTKICGSGKDGCVKHAEDELKRKELEAIVAGVSIKDMRFCHCKPSCTSLDYTMEVTNGHLVNIPNYQKFPDNGSHWSAIRVYFKSEQFIPLERNELYGFFDLIANIGGILGLFLGCSLITFFEIIYFLSLRMYCNKKLHGNLSGQVELDQVKSTQTDPLIYS